MLKFKVVPLLLCVATFSAAGVTKLVHISRDGDAVDLLRCELLNPGSSGVDAVWDFSETEFDHKVESVANSFGNNKQITYHFAPTISDMTEGNCNTSTSTILLKSGVSKSSIQNIKKEIPGISLGFSIIARPWTEQEQKNAVKYQEAADFLIDIISNP